MSPRVFDSLVAALIRIGLLVGLVIMLIAENAQAKRSLVPHISVPGTVAAPGRVFPAVKAPDTPFSR